MTYATRRTSTCVLVATVMLALVACGDDDSPGTPDAARDATTIDLGTRIDMAAPPPDAARDDARSDGAMVDDATADDATPDDAAGEDANRPDADGPLRDGGFRCDIPECFRPVICVPRCGEEPVVVGCCPCPPGTIDSIECRPDTGPPLPPGELCGPDRGECTEGYSCCYPCGIPGCDNICEPTCDESTPGCAGGCLLRP